MLAVAGLAVGPLLQILLGLLGSAGAVRGGSALAKSLLGGTAKKIGSGAGSALAKAAGTDIGQKVGRGAMAARGALPGITKGLIPESREAAISSLGNIFKRDIGMGALGIGGFLGGGALVDSLLGESSPVVGEASLAGQPANTNDGLSSLIDVISGDVADGNLQSPELQELLNVLSTQQQPQRRLI